jgi:hypothetical protein
VKLEPAHYGCPEHKSIDLTPETLAAVGASESTVASFAFRAAKRRTRGDEPFLVLVTCPGDGEPHTLAMRGRFRRD